VLVEVLLQFLCKEKKIMVSNVLSGTGAGTGTGVSTVGEVDAELLELILLENFETENVQNANRGAFETGITLPKKTRGFYSGVTVVLQWCYSGVTVAVQ
jgi:hypothetical protein